MEETPKLSYFMLLCGVSPAGPVWRPCSGCLVSGDMDEVAIQFSGI